MGKRFGFERRNGRRKKETAGGEKKRQAERRNGKRRKETAGGEKNGRQGKEMAGRGKQQQARKRQFLCGEVGKTASSFVLYGPRDSFTVL